MSRTQHLDTHPLPLAQETEVERVADGFEAEWAAGRRPRAEDYLDSITAQTLRASLLGELLRVEVAVRRAAGEQPSLEEFLSRFPANAEAIRDLFCPPTVTVTGPVESPDRIGKYEIIRLLGRGGQAETYLAFDPDLRRQVVLKLFHAAQAPEEQDLVLREGQALARVRSPFLGQCHGAERAGDRSFLVMEYVPGKTLAETLREQPPSLREAVRLVEQVAEGLAAVHASGLLHRDLKPSNILLGDDGVPRLIDFGLASPLASDATRGVSGTLPYMAPEQARGQCERIDVRSDVFGLGAVLYELLTGRPPYQGSRQDEVWEQAREGRVIAPRQLKKTVPKALERICMRALAAQPARRFGSASDFQRALRGYRRRPLRVGGAGLIAVCALGVLLTLIRRESPPRLEGLEAATANATRPLSGELILEVWSTGTGGKRGLRVEEPGALPVRRGELVHLEARVNQPAYLYLLWLDGQGRVDPLYPWIRDFRAPREADAPRAHLNYPAEAARGLPVQGPSGLETALLLARRTPLPATTDLTAVIGPLPPAPLRNPLEFAVRGFDSGRPTGAIDLGVHRGLGLEAEKIDEPLLRLMDRLRPHFDLIRAVRFAYQGD